MISTEDCTPSSIKFESIPDKIRFPVHALKVGKEQLPSVVMLPSSIVLLAVMVTSPPLDQVALPFPHSLVLLLSDAFALSVFIKNPSESKLIAAAVKLPPAV